MNRQRTVPCLFVVTAGTSAILQNYALDGVLNFGGNQLLLMSGILVGKNVWRNRGLFI